MPPIKRPYPPEFRREAVELTRTSDRSISQVARDLGVSDQTLRNWIKQADIDTGKREGLTTDEREELRCLRRENRTLLQEREILKKAAVPSGRQRNAASSVSAGVLKPRVSLGRVFNLAAIASSSA
jgi:transposase